MSDKEKNNDNQNNKSKKGIIILLIILIIVILVAAAIIIYLLTRPKKEEIPNDGRGTVVTKNNIDSIDFEEEIEDGYFTTQQTVDWHFKGNVSDDAYVANAVENERTVYFDLLLPDTEEIIYSSPYIPVGSELTQIELNKQLAPGDYELKMVYHLVDDNNNEVSKLNVAVDVNVE